MLVRIISKHLLKLVESISGFKPTGVGNFIYVLFKNVILTLEEASCKVTITLCIWDVDIPIGPLGAERSLVIIYKEMVRKSYRYTYILQSAPR